MPHHSQLRSGNRTRPLATQFAHAEHLQPPPRLNVLNCHWRLQGLPPPMLPLPLFIFTTVKCLPSHLFIEVPTALTAQLALCWTKLCGLHPSMFLLCMIFLLNSRMLLVLLFGPDKLFMF